MVEKHIGKFSERKKDSHKGDYGKVFVVAGSVGLTGAAYLTAQAALKTGSGLVTLGIPESLNDIMEVKLTEVMTLPLSETTGRSISKKAKEKIFDYASGCDVLAMGPGMGRESETQELIKQIVAGIDKTLILDADAINALAGQADVLETRSFPTVITPHPGEMARLFNVDVAEVQSNRQETAKSAAQKTGAVVCLKGHETVVASPDGEIYVNTTGNSGMACGGTGDVLTGMIASFIGQGIEPYSAAVSAVYLHGLAGDIGVEEVGAFYFTAIDLIEFLPEAFDRAGI